MPQHIRITIAVQNAAFEEDGGAEVARILEALAVKYLERGIGLETVIHDRNGNRVGNAVLEGN